MLDRSRLRRRREQSTRSKPIQIHVDLNVNPAKEKQMLQYFEKEFKPAAAKFEGSSFPCPSLEFTRWH